MAKINYKKMCEMLNVDDKFVKNFIASEGEERDRILIEMKDNNVKLSNADYVVENTKFACRKYGKSDYPKYEALNSIACSICCFIVCDAQESYQKGLMTDEEWCKFGKGR